MSCIAMQRSDALCAETRGSMSSFSLQCRDSEGVHPVYRNPGYSDDPYPGGVLVSGDPILVPNRSHLLPAVPVESVKSSVPPLAEMPGVGSSPLADRVSELERVAALSDTELRSHIDRLGIKFAKKVMPSNLGPMSVAHAEFVRQKLMTEWDDAHLQFEPTVVPAACPSLMPTPPTRNVQWLRQKGTSTLHTAPIPLSTKPAWYVDLCAGTSSALRYHLLADPNARVVAFDVLPKSEIMCHIPKQFHSRFHYRQIDVSTLDYDLFVKELDAVGCCVHDVAHVHISPPCTTYSVAHHGKNFHRDGVDPVSWQAHEDDTLVRNTCNLLHDVTTRHPSIMATAENPLGLWAGLQCVQDLAQRPNWQLVERIDHCMMTSELDEGYFPNKPSSWLLFNCDAQDDVVCDCQCNNRFTERGKLRYHRVLICNRTTKLPEQRVLKNALEKAAIPLGMFGHLMARHHRHRSVQSSQPGPPSLHSSAPAQLHTAPILDPTSQFDRQLLCTGKKAIESSINDRVQRLHGKSYEEAIGMEYRSNTGLPKFYKPADYRYDMEHGYIRHAAMSTAATPHEKYVAALETQHHLECAMLTASGGEPPNRKLAKLRADWPCWRDAECCEMESLEKNGVLRWVPCAKVPPGTKLIANRLVYKHKVAMPGVPERYKCRLVAKGFLESQAEYGDKFAPVCRLETCRAFFAAACYHRYSMCSIDICSAFRTAPINRNVYIAAPEGFERPGYVCKLERNLEGLASAPRAYYLSFDKYLSKHGFAAVGADPCLYYNSSKDLWLLMYCDDLILAGSPASQAAFKKELAEEYEFRDYGEPQSFLGMEVTRDQTANTLHLTQRAYIKQLATQYDMLDSNRIDTPMPDRIDDLVLNSPLLKDPSIFRAIVGQLMYCHVACRFDITWAVSQLSKRLAQPTEMDMTAAKRVVQYLHHHPEIGPKYSGNSHTALIGYSDADYAGDVATRRSTSGRVFMFMGSAISWASKQQRTVATSTAQSEYCAMSDCAREALWLRQLVGTLLKLEVIPTTTLFEDNSAAQKWCYNPLNHAKQKHIDIAYHFVREQCTQFLNLNVVPIGTTDMLGDLYTKNLAGPRHQYLVQRIGNHTDPALATKLTEPVGSTVTAGVHAFSDKLRGVFGTNQRIDDKQPFFDEYFAEKPFLELAGG